MLLIKRTVLIVTLLAGLPLILARAEGTPKIAFDQTVYDFGKTSAVQFVAGSFTFRNVGDGELRITNLITTCACTHAGVNPSSLKPGESGSLDFTLNVGPSVGNISEKIFLNSNDPQNSTVTLTLKVYVQPIFEVTPQSLRLGDLQKRSTTNITVLVRRTDGQKLRITEVVSDNPLISARIRPVKESRSQAANLVIQFKAADRPGLFEDAVKIHTGEMYAEDIPKPSFAVTLTGRVIAVSQ